MHHCPLYMHVLQASPTDHEKSCDAAVLRLQVEPCVDAQPLQKVQDLIGVPGICNIQDSLSLDILVNSFAEVALNEPGNLLPPSGANLKKWGGREGLVVKVGRERSEELFATYMANNTERFFNGETIKLEELVLLCNDLWDATELCFGPIFLPTLSTRGSRWELINRIASPVAAIIAMKSHLVQQEDPAITLFDDLRGALPYEVGGEKFLICDPW